MKNGAFIVANGLVKYSTNLMWDLNHILPESCETFLCPQVQNVGLIRPLFVFSSLSYNEKYGTKFDAKSIDGVLGIRTCDRRMA